MQLSVRDTAKFLSVTEKTIYRWIQGAGLPAYRVEGQYRINKALLLEWATAKKVNIRPDLFADDNPGEKMRSLTDSLKLGGIYYRLEGIDKTSVLRSVVDLLKLPGGIDREFLLQALVARETLQSTGIGDGVAIPHVRNPMILEIDVPAISLCFLEHPIDFDALDGIPVSTIFTLISPTVRMHLHLLARLSFVLQNTGFKTALKRQSSREIIFEKLNNAESSIKLGTAGDSHGEKE